jgi:hypothetical protein
LDRRLPPDHKELIMKVKTNVKAGGLDWNHNETLARAAAKGKGPQGKAPGLKVKTNVKAGGYDFNHNETLVRAGSRRSKAR